MADLEYVRVEWDAENMKAKGMPEVEPMIKREYREGWEPDFG